MAGIPPVPGPAGGADGGVGAPPPNLSNLRRVANAFGGIFSVLGKKAVDWTSKEVEERWDGLKLLFALSMLMPLISFTAGTLIGRLGVWQEAAWMITTADWIISVGGFLGAVLVTYLWAKLMIYGHLIGYGSHGLNQLSMRIPALDTDAIERFLVWARGWTAWWMGAMLYVIAVPVYQDLTMTAIALLSMLALAGILSARWFDGPWARRFLLVGVLTVFVLSTLALFIPGLTRSVRSWTTGLLSDAAVVRDRETELNSVDRDAERERTETLTKLSKNFSQRRTALERSMLKCGGQFCTAADAAEYRLLGQKIAWIRDGEYVERMAGGGSKAPTKAATNPGNNSGPSKAPAAKQVHSGRLPPPPRVSATPRGSHHARRRSVVRSSAPVLTKRKRGPSGLPRVTHREIDYIFAPIN